MKIIYGITKSNFGGAQRYVYELAKEARERGHEVAVLCGGKGVLVDKLEAENIRVITLPYLQRDISLFYEIKSFFFIFRTLVKEEPDIFHTNSSKMGGLGNFAARLAGVKKIIFTGHGWAFNENRPWHERAIIKFLHWLTIAFSHLTICVSEKTKGDVAWPLIKNRLVVIKNGQESFELIPRSEARKTLGIPEQALAVGTIGELHWVKGHDTLLLAWAEFVKKNTEAKLVIISEGEEKSNLINMAKALGVSDSVIFAGFIYEARKLVRAFDIYAFPSRSENLPYAVLEAGFAGLPVIASAVGGIPEIIESDSSGILVPPNNPQALLAALNRLANDKTLRQTLGVNLQKTIKEKFSLVKMLQKTFTIYTGARRS